MVWLLGEIETVATAGGSVLEEQPKSKLGMAMIERESDKRNRGIVDIGTPGLSMSQMIATAQSVIRQTLMST